MVSHAQVLKPSEVDEHLGWFDRFATRAANLCARAPFAFGCVVLVALWLAEGVVKTVSGGWGAFLDSSYQLQINTTTTILTFLIVAVFQNSQSRNDAAAQQKANAIADALADLIEYIAKTGDMGNCQDLLTQAEELRAAVGLEHREDSKAATGTG